MSLQTLLTKLKSSFRGGPIMNIRPNIEVDIRPTPNPDALKFILNIMVKSVGKATYNDALECQNVPLAQGLFSIDGVEHIHLFGNVVTVTKNSAKSWDDLCKNVESLLKLLGEEHDPDYERIDPEVERRQSLPKDLLEIIGIIDRTIRPALQADGGDLECLAYNDNILLIRYQGACGHCPSAITGTLETIKAILREEFNPNIEVYIAPETAM